MNKKTISPEPGIRVRALREQLGLTRKQFEDITGFKSTTLRHLENGGQFLRPTTARMLSNFFIHCFGLEPDEASEHFILNGEKEDNSTQEQ